MSSALHRVLESFFLFFKLRFLFFIFPRARVLFVYSVREERESKRGGPYYKSLDIKPHQPSHFPGFSYSSL